MGFENSIGPEIQKKHVYGSNTVVEGGQVYLFSS